MKYKIKEFESVNLRISETLESQIFSLNKKFKRLENITEKYFKDNTEINFEQVKDAFISKSDPSILMSEYKDFVQEYLEEVIRIRNEFSMKEEDTFDITAAKQSVGVVRNRVKNSLEKIHERFIFSTKKDMLSDITRMQEKDIDEIKKKKYEAQIELKKEELEEFISSNEFVSLDSVKRDLSYLLKLLDLINNKPKINKKLTNTIFAISSSIISLVIGAAIWVTMF